jgi:hypothetical protein
VEELPMGVWEKISLFFGVEEIAEIGRGKDPMAQRKLVSRIYVFEQALFDFVRLQEMEERFPLFRQFYYERFLLPAKNSTGLFSGPAPKDDPFTNYVASRLAP